jgi:very-short-patch-repair endonuclease
MPAVADRALPAPDAGEWEWLLFRQHGVVSRRQALRFMSSKVLWRNTASGRWRAEHRGVYVTHNGPLTPHQHLWVASLAVGSGRPALLGGLSALAVLGLRRFTSSAVHVLIPSRCRDNNPPAGVRVHRTSHLPAIDIHQRSDPPCTHAPRSVVDAAQWARSDAEARTIIAAAFQQRLVGGDEVERVLGRMPTVRRRALVLRTAKDACDGSETITELDLVSLCRTSGLPIPSRQVIRRDASGRKRYLDAYFDDWRIRIEIDGAHHMQVEQWWSDMARHNDLSVRGEVVLRFPAWMVREQPNDVVATIRDALISAGWHPHQQ